MPLTQTERALVEALPGVSELLSELRGLVAECSHTPYKEGVDRVGRLCEDALEKCGFRVAVMVTGVGGKHLIARRAGSSKRLLLIGHLDTVHPRESPFRELQVADGQDRATGPGAADMKGGIVVMLAALRALEAAGRLDGRNVTVILNADEETGSPDSTEVIRMEAEEADLALAFERGSELDGGRTAIVTARRGIGRMALVATGAAAHSGNETDRGASAILELASKIPEVSALESVERRWHVNVGTFRGGTAANVVAESAEMTIDYRFPDKESGEELGAAIEDIVAEPRLRSPAGRPLVRVVCREHVIRPPLVRSDAVAAAAARIIEAGRDLGQAIVEEARGGSSDAALAFDAGCAAVCGLGVVGGAIHTDQEWIRPSSLRERAALTALVADRFLSEAP
jgi:glutamate carboxypeptidase